MKVNQLINLLKVMPPDAEVKHVWDGEPRTDIEHVWLSESGHVMTADNGQSVYSQESRPKDAAKNEHWGTPGNGGW